MEARPKFQEGRHPAVGLDVARRRFGDAGDNAQECALAGAVGARDAQAFASFKRERNVLERPEIQPGVVRIPAQETPRKREDRLL